MRVAVWMLLVLAAATANEDGQPQVPTPAESVHAPTLESVQETAHHVVETVKEAVVGVDGEIVTTNDHAEAVPETREEEAAPEEKHEEVKEEEPPQEESREVQTEERMTEEASDANEAADSETNEASVETPQVDEPVQAEESKDAKEEESPESKSGEESKESSADKLDPNCPSRDLIIRCTGKHMDKNNNGKLDRDELTGAINALPW
jgi:hypothetical protein